MGARGLSFDDFNQGEAARLLPAPPPGTPPAETEAEPPPPAEGTPDLEALVLKELEDFKALYAWFDPPQDRLSGMSLYILRDRLVRAVRRRMSEIVDTIVRGSVQQAEQARLELAVARTMIEDGDLAILQELQDTYALVRVLLDKIGGSVAVTPADLAAAARTQFTTERDQQTGNWNLTLTKP